MENGWTTRQNRQENGARNRPFRLQEMRQTFQGRSEQAKDLKLRIGTSLPFFWFLIDSVVTAFSNPRRKRIGKSHESRMNLQMLTLLLVNKVLERRYSSLQKKVDVLNVIRLHPK